MDIDPNAPQRPWLASINRFLFFLICLVSASITLIICLAICIIVYSIINIDVNLGHQ